MTRKQTDFAWAAGFLDGEGCFSLSKHGDPRGDLHATTRQPTLSVSQARRESLDKLASIIGGNVRPLKGRGWQIAISGQRLQEVIPPLLPYLCQKRGEAEVALEYAKTVRRRGRVVIPQKELDLRASLIARHEKLRRWWD